MFSSLAELESKVSLKEGQLKAHLTSQLEKQRTNVSEAAQRIKEMREETESKVKQLEENQKLIDKTLSVAIQKTHTDLEDLAKEAKELAAKLTAKTNGDIPGGIVANARSVFEPAQAASGATLVPIMPGNIIHSNSIKPEEVWSQLVNDPTLKGFSEDQAAVVTRKVLELLNTRSMQVGLPAQLPGSDAQTTGREEKPAEDDEELTDVELSEDEVEAASVNAKEKGEAEPIKTKKVTRATKKKILLKQGTKGGGGGGTVHQGHLKKPTVAVASK